MQEGKNEIILFLILSTGMLLLLVALIVTLLYLYRRRQIKYFQSMQKLKLDHEKNLLQARVEIQETTFQHISREIHDNISLSLTLAKLHLNTLNWKNTSSAREMVDSSVELITRSIEDMRTLSRSLNSDIIIHHGLIEALKKETEKISKPGLFNINMQVKGDPVYMDAEKELVIFRIAQEAFNNIIKHSGAKNTELIMYYNNDHMELSITDDGKGFEYPLPAGQKCNGSGLNNILARVQMLNGKSTIRTRPGKGTSIDISIPY